MMNILLPLIFYLIYLCFKKEQYRIFGFLLLPLLSYLVIFICLFKIESSMKQWREYLKVFIYNVNKAIHTQNYV